MAQVIFRLNKKEQSLKSNLVIDYTDGKNNILEKELRFSYGEELEFYMKSIFSEKWEALFSEQERKNGIVSCSIKGISITGQNDKGRLAVHILDGYAQGTSIINDSLIKDENAQKIKEILEIAKR